MKEAEGTCSFSAAPWPASAVFPTLNQQVSQVPGAQMAGAGGAGADEIDRCDQLFRFRALRPAGRHLRLVKCTRIWAGHGPRARVDGPRCPERSLTSWR
jgi:hypothetical protein